MGDGPSDGAGVDPISMAGVGKSINEEGTTTKAGAGARANDDVPMAPAKVGSSRAGSAGGPTGTGVLPPEEVPVVSSTAP